MSKYRDDSHDIAVAGDSTWAGLTSIVEDSVKITAVTIFILGVLHSDSAIATDEPIDRATHTVVERAIASDKVIDAAYSRQLVVDQAKVSAQHTERLRIVHSDTAHISDLVLDSLLHVFADSAKAIVEVIGQRYVATIITDHARASDFIVSQRRELIEELATASDLQTGKLRAKDLLVDGATASETVEDSHRGVAPILADSAQVRDQVIDHLAAVDLIKDMAATEGVGVSVDGEYGQAWTSNYESWAMSRYAPYSFTELAVVNGALYGIAIDGLYALSGSDEQISGRITTGKLDVGEGGLVHPISAYIEYELDGTAEIDITTTQSGTAQTYTYPLAAEISNELTNGRFIFGRGLRGRHFSFELRIDGLSGHINDLSVTTTQTKRRV